MAGLDGINSSLANAFAQMQAASPYPLGITSGFRTYDQQAALYEKYKNGTGNLAAPPGSSNHESGNAIDLNFYGNDAAVAWVHANAARFGVHFPVRGENWHMEFIGGGGNPGAGLDPEALRYNLTYGGAEPQNPEDVLSSRLDSIMQMIGGGDFEAGTPAEMIEGDLQGIEPTTVTPTEGSVRTVEFGSQGRGGAMPTGGGGGGDIKSMVRSLAQQMGWGEDQWPALERLVQKESSWNPTAQNPTSTAYGLFQFLDSTWQSYGQKTSDPAAQARAGLAYIRDRYGSPTAALSFHEQNNWY